MSSLKKVFYVLFIAIIFLLFFLNINTNKDSIIIKYAILLSPKLPFDENKVKINLEEARKFLQDKCGVKMFFVYGASADLQNFPEKNNLAPLRKNFSQNSKEEIQEELKKQVKNSEINQLRDNMFTNFLHQYNSVRNSMLVSKASPYEFDDIILARTWKKLLEVEQPYDLLITNELIADIIFRNTDDQNQNLYEFATFNGITNLETQKMLVSTFEDTFNLKYNSLISRLPKDYFIQYVILHEIFHSVFDIEDKPYLTCIMNPYLDEFKIFSEQPIISLDTKNEIKAWKHFNKANLYIKGKPKKAISELEKSLKIKEDYMPALELLIEAYRDVDDAEKASELKNKLNKLKNIKKELYETSIKIIIAYRKGVNLQSKGQHNEAIQEYKKILDFDYSSFNNKNYLQSLFLSVLKNLSEIYFHRSNFEEAIHFLNQAIKIEPRDADLYYLLGMCHLNKDDDKKAAEYFKYYLKLLPNGDRSEIIKLHLSKIKSDAI